MLVALTGQSLAGTGAHSLKHSPKDCSAAGSKSVVAENAYQSAFVHSQQTLYLPKNTAHSNHLAHGDAEEQGSMSISMKDNMAMSEGNCCFDECACETSTCSNVSLIVATQHLITGLTYSEHVATQQRSEPKSISSSLFRPPIVG